MTEQTVSNKDAYHAFVTLRKYCMGHECGSCSMNHICSGINHGEYEYMVEIFNDAAGSITMNWVEDNA